jgi:hypothetical protein
LKIDPEIGCFGLLGLFLSGFLFRLLMIGPFQKAPPNEDIQVFFGQKVALSRSRAAILWEIPG